MLIRSRAPLRLGFAGGGSDVSPYSDIYGGHVLNVTIDMYAYCVIEAWDKEQIVFAATDREETYAAHSQSYLDFNGHLDLHKAVYNRVVRQFNRGEPLSLKMTTYSDAPAGSGLGSSSTMVVAMLSAYVEWLNLPLGEYEIARIAYEVERLELGLAGGRQDTYAATFGGFNFIEFEAEERVIVNPLRIKNWMINELESSLVLYYTDAPRESAKILKDQIKNVETQNQEALEATHEIKRDAVLMKEYILKGSLQDIAKILGRSWEAKKKLASSISNPIIEQAYEIALKAGAYSGKISGAGGGGFIIFMVDPTKRMDVIRALNQLDGSVRNFHFVQQGAESWAI
ncbi:MAG: GHMP kinase [Calothrix sp. MO_167.B12]|nr:GHMP kinase [Calothrix sp. MO_167.B12]